MENLVMVLNVSGLRKWKFQSGWGYLIPAIIVIPFSIFIAVELILSVNGNIERLQTANIYTYWYFISLLLLPSSIMPYKHYSKEMYGKQLKLKVSFDEKVVTGTFMAKNGDTRSNKIEIEYVKEYVKYFKIGRSFYNFYFLPKSKLSKEQLEAIRSLKKPN